MLQTHHNMLWMPKRCEAEGCEETATLKQCKGCHMVMYCSKCASRQRIQSDF